MPFPQDRRAPAPQNSSTWPPATCSRDIEIELIDGELQRLPPSVNVHGRLQMAVITGLLKLLPDRPMFAEIGTDLGNDTIVAADAAVPKAPLAGEGMILADAIAPVVEVAVSTRERDLG